MDGAYGGRFSHILILTYFMLIKIIIIYLKIIFCFDHSCLELSEFEDDFVTEKLISDVCRCGSITCQRSFC